MEGQITASEIQAQPAFHLPSDASPAAVVDGEDTAFVTVVKAETVPEKVVIGKFNSGIQHICFCLKLGISGKDCRGKYSLAAIPGQ